MFGLLEHPKIARSQALANEIAAWLRERGETVWQGSVWDEAGLAAQMAGWQMVIVLGGDGAILRVARAAAPLGVPIFSVNLGKVGFLSEAQPEEWPQRLAQALQGDFWLERRLMIRARLWRAGLAQADVTALNEVVVGRGSQARVIHLELFVDDDPVTRYTADGVIAATPTGSTAYALAAGGPILPPELENFLLVPVAPHLSLDRALVLPENATVRLRVTMDHEAVLTVDGQIGLRLESGDEIVIERADYDCLFVRVNQRRYFYQRLVQGLRVGDPQPASDGASQGEG